VLPPRPTRLSSCATVAPCGRRWGSALPRRSPSTTRSTGAGSARACATARSSPGSSRIGPGARSPRVAFGFSASTRAPAIRDAYSPTSCRCTRSPTPAVAATRAASSARQLPTRDASDCRAWRCMPPTPAARSTSAKGSSRRVRCTCGCRREHPVARRPPTPTVRLPNFSCSRPR